jgi:hypothetical protein
VPYAGKETKGGTATDKGIENKVYFGTCRTRQSSILIVAIFMHITKNMCMSLLGTLLNMPEKTKYMSKARNDLIVY